MSNMLEIGYTSAVDKSVFESSEAALALLEEAEYDAAEFLQTKEDTRKSPRVSAS